MNSSCWRLFIGTAVILGLLAPQPAEAVRFMTYNLLNYSSGRSTQFQAVIAGTQPDVIVVQEILSQTAVDNFLNTVLEVVDPGEWAAGPFVNGTDTDNAFFYRTSAVTFVSHFIVGTALRDIDEYTFRPATHSTSAADIRAYVVHLKASQGSANVAKRLAEVQLMRARMETFPAGGHYLIAGDFNIYTSTESPFVDMLSLNGGPNGVVVDPINRIGNWHINSSFADIHTQSPRTTSFGGGATGGLDDRFDMILTSPALGDGEQLDLLASTYKAFGQDGAHFDGPLNVAPYDSVDAATAQNLHDASDHLPVIADFQNFALLVADASLDLGTVIVGGAADELLSVTNAAAAGSDDLDYSFTAPSGFTAPAGSFSLLAGAPTAFHSIALDTGAAGMMAGNLVITSDDPDAASQNVPLTGTVLDHAVPSTDGGGVQVAQAVDFGGVFPGNTAPASVDVHNVGYGSLQALLDVYSGTIVGDPRFSIDGGFTPGNVAGTPVSYGLTFDGVGAAEGLYTATLTFQTRDQQDLDGAIALSDLVFDLSANVSTAVSAVSVASAPDETGFVAVWPNPLRSSTRLSFGLREAADTDLRIYSVTGRMVRTLTSGNRAAGIHVETWDGRDDSRRELAPGIYFARFISGATVETRKLVKVN